MTKYTVYALNTAGTVVGSTWTYHRTQVKTLVMHFKKYTSAAGVMVGGKVWMF